MVKKMAQNIWTKALGIKEAEKLFLDGKISREEYLKTRMGATTTFIK